MHETQGFSFYATAEISTTLKSDKLKNHFLWKKVEMLCPSWEGTIIVGFLLMLKDTLRTTLMIC